MGGRSEVGFRSALAAILTLGSAWMTVPAAAAPPVRHPHCQLRVSSPYTSRHPLRFTLLLVLNARADQYVATVAFSGITVHDSRHRERPWTLRGEASRLRAKVSIHHTINAIDDQDVGLVHVHVIASKGSTFDPSARNLRLHNNPPADPAVAEDAEGTDGLGGRPHVIASARRGRGVVTLSGDLRVVAPTSTPPGSYRGTLTFTVGCSRAVVPVKPPKRHHHEHHHKHHHKHHRSPGAGPSARPSPSPSPSASPSPSTTASPSPAPITTAVVGGGQPPSTSTPSAPRHTSTRLPALAGAAALTFLAGTGFWWAMGRRKRRIRAKHAAAVQGPPDGGGSSDQP